MQRLCVGFAGTFSASMEPRVRAQLATPCDVIVADESGIVARLADVDVLVTLGFLGYGRIGQEVARRARAFDMDVLAIRRDTTQHDPHGVTLHGPEAFDGVIARANYLAVTLPLTDETRGLIGDTQFRAMKSNAIVINVARAQLIDEEALYRGEPPLNLVPAA